MFLSAAPDPDGHWVWFAINAGFAAYDGYKAYKSGQGWKGVVKAATKGAIGGGKFKAVKRVYQKVQNYQSNRIARKMDFDSSAAKHMGESERYVPTQILAKAIVHGKKGKDGAKGYNSYSINMHKLEKSRPNNEVTPKN
ncbi:MULTISPECIES: hypothetical protein [Bacillus]|uniref:hypothetical protein n=1 Tax=Bacillus TaxID=1386 RepID=UPI001CC24FD7|nr:MULTISPECIES: hypothetical protein [Bacillus]MDY8160882.1 hypothetical protein [Bacillus thuringiensis]MEC3155151.1 hypothetical protein [Bacillus thuringiensis]